VLAIIIFALLEKANCEPPGGIGKPEILKHLGSGYLSRYISQEHRLTYCVVGKSVQFLAARFHYDKK
jgi:toxin YoeB